MPREARLLRRAVWVMFQSVRRAQAATAEYSYLGEPASQTLMDTWARGRYLLRVAAQRLTATGTALCRRERIYSSHLAGWRKQRAAGAPLEAKRGRKPDPQGVEITQLRKKAANLEQRLAKAERVIPYGSALFETTRPPEVYCA